MLFIKIKNSIFKVLIELFIFDRTKRAKIKACWAKKYLKKYVEFAVQNTVVPISNKQEENSQEGSDNSHIWQYWHQGAKNAPPLIQRCLESTEKYHSDKKIVVLDYEKIQDYIELPSKYYDMVNQGKMKTAFFSDILRTYLLAQYGGTWVDATIYLTGRIPDDILNSAFFVLSKNPEKYPSGNKMSNYFIHSKPNCVVIEAIKSALNEYWRENDFVINYFMYEHIATMLSENEVIKKIWDKMPYYDTAPVGALQKVLYEDFSKETFEKIASETNIHKLSYKVLKETSSGKSFYDKIIENCL